MNSANPVITESAMGKSRALYVLAVACFPLALTGLLTLLVFVTGLVERDDGIGHHTEFAQFNYPVPGKLVGGEFTVEGVISQVPSGQSVYLVESKDGAYWPKKDLGKAPTVFSRDQKTSAGAGYKYTIELLSLDAKALNRIEQWFETARATGKYPGIRDWDGAKPLAKLRVIHR